jgi:hypothetical protein
MMLDHARRSDVVGLADDQQLIQTKLPCFVQHSPERPRGDTVTTSGWSDSISDVAHSGYEVGELVTQGNTTQQFASLDNPSVGAIELVDKAADPNSKPLSRLDLIGFAETKAILVLSRPPFMVRLEPCQVEAGVGSNQGRHRLTLLAHLPAVQFRTLRLRSITKFVDRLPVVAGPDPTPSLLHGGAQQTII